MTALRCCCRRCAGGVIFSNVPDYLAHHQLGLGEFVLDSEVTVARAEPLSLPSYAYKAAAEPTGDPDE